MSAIRRVWIAFGIQVHDARLAKRWSVSRLAEKAGVSRALAYLIEAGEPASLESAVRIANALGLKIELELVDPRRRGDNPVRSVDPVHSLMGEFEAAHLRALRFPTGIDEPYQHFQFAGRAA